MTRETTVMCDGPGCDAQGPPVENRFTAEVDGEELDFCSRDCMVTHSQQEDGYTVFVKSHGEWIHYGFRDTEQEAVDTVRHHIERSDPAFYVPGVTHLEDWDVDINPAA